MTAAALAAHWRLARSPLDSAAASIGRITSALERRRKNKSRVYPRGYNFAGKTVLRFLPVTHTYRVSLSAARIERRKEGP